MNAIHNWFAVPWEKYYQLGSASAVDHQNAFLQRGSGDASMLEENDRLNRLESRAIGGDKQAGDAPSHRAVELAREWLKGIYWASTRTSRRWVAPHITASDGGEVVFEWWRGERKITLYFGQGPVEYFKVWGPDIEEQMESGELKSADAFRLLWSWLGA